MSQPTQNETKAQSGAPDPARDWSRLTWDDLEQWAGDRSVSRGRAYQRQKRVSDLAVTEDGRLLATVSGGDRYAVTVWMAEGAADSALESRCTCPVGANGCKHAVAVVAAYLDDLANGTKPPTAKKDDPRWAQLDGADLEETGDEWEEDEETAEEADNPPARTLGNPDVSRQARQDWDQKIEAHIRAKDAKELADLVVSLTRRFPELHEEFRERIALQQGDAKNLVAQARGEIREVTSEAGWRHHWDDEGHTPDYSHLKSRLERLVELGHADEVVALGRELMDRGFSQVAESDDEGETATALGECLPVVFGAVSRSSLPAVEKLLFAVDAHLDDEYDVVGESAEAILNAAWPKADWSALADALAERLELRAGKGDSRDYHRDQISGWLCHALEKAGRAGEVLALMEAEARATHSYERLVQHLIAQERLEDAERWAREGIEKTAERWPGIAQSLAKSLRDLAERKKEWPVVAAHEALGFVERPSAAGFQGLLKAAAKAGCQEAVRVAAFRFLETGDPPFHLATSAKGKPALKVAEDWPLPVPEYFGVLMRRPNPQAPCRSGPHFGVLIEMAIAERRPADVLTWYDKMRAAHPQSGTGRWYAFEGSYEGPVVDAVWKTHPERALGLLRPLLAKQTEQTGIPAYESVAATLRKMRPILASLGREEEWTKTVGDLRLKHRNRPRFTEILDRLGGRSILDLQKARGTTKK